MVLEKPFEIALVQARVGFQCSKSRLELFAVFMVLQFNVYGYLEDSRECYVVIMG